MSAAATTSHAIATVAATMTAAMMDIAVAVIIQGTTTGPAVLTTPAPLTERDPIMGQAVMTLTVRGLLTTKCVLHAAATATDLRTTIVTRIVTFAVVSCTSHKPPLFPCLDPI